MSAQPQQLGSFLLGDKLGSGAMGVVYRATHVKTGAVAAVKIITLRDDQPPRANSEDRFDREYKILQQFRHPGIVRWLAAGRSKGTRYFAMEFVDGRTLDVLIGDHQAMDWPLVIDLGVQMCDALQYAHDHGVVHRDLKPSNLMVTSTNQVKLTDFGIAKDLDATALTAPGRTLGTAAYMAPEQIRGTSQISHKIDLYALGCVFFQMLTGELPFQGNNVGALMNAHLNQPPPRPSEKSPRIPRALDDLIVRMMAKDPPQRPWDAAAVAHELNQIREMLAKGEPIKMVFGPPYVSEDIQRTAATQEIGTDLLDLKDSQGDVLGSTAAGTINRAVATATPTPTAAPRKKKKKKKGAGWKRPSAASLGLAAAAAGLIGLIGFLLLPPSADNLYAKAQPLMQSDDVVKWQDADRQYLTEFERRFPNDPRVAEIPKLRDRILLHMTKGRARLLTTLGKPQNEAEEAYVKALKRADDAEKSGYENVSAESWIELAASYQKAMEQASADQKAMIKGWALLASEKAAEMTATVEERTASARKRLLEATTAEANGQEEFGAERRRSLIRDFSAYPYLKATLDEARQGLTEDDAPPADSPAEEPAK